MNAKDDQPQSHDLHQQDFRARLIPGWNQPRPASMPRPTVWPAGLAFALIFLVWGIVTSLILSVLGAVLLVIALAGWIGEMRHEQ